MTNDADGTVSVSRVTFWDNRALLSVGGEDSGLGGGIYSLGDAGAVYENVTIANNLAQARAGGFYVDADAGVQVVNSTIAYNTAPIGSGVADEGTNLNPPTAQHAVIFRNTIIAGNVGRERLQLLARLRGRQPRDGGTSCHAVQGTIARPLEPTVFSPTPHLDAVADNGGHHLDDGAAPGNAWPSTAACYALPGLPTSAAWRVRRTTRCDSGAFEYEGALPAARREAPKPSSRPGRSRMT